MRSVRADAAEVRPLGREDTDDQQQEGLVEGRARESYARVDEQRCRPQQHRKRDDDPIQLEVERQACRKPIATYWNEQDDDQDQRDQALPPNNGAVSYGNDGDDPQHRCKDACSVSAHDCHRQQTERADDGDGSRVATRSAQERAHDVRRYAWWQRSAPKLSTLRRGHAA